MDTTNSIRILIPTYNDSPALLRILPRLLEYVPSRQIVIVDDGSAEDVRSLFAGYPEITVLRHAANKGLGAAMRTGLACCVESGCEGIIKFDADGQMEATYIPRMIALFSSANPDIILTTYEPDMPASLKKDFWLYSALYFLASGRWLKDICTDFRLYSKRSALYYLEHEQGQGYATKFILLDMLRRGFRAEVLEGGVHMGVQAMRPFPLKGLIVHRWSFMRRLWRYGVRGKLSAILAGLILFPLLAFNMVTAPQFNAAPRSR